MSYTTKLFCTINLVFLLYGCTGLNSSTESIKSPVVKQTSTTASKSKKPIVLVTGGMGYIGSHVCVVLLNAGYDVIILDNLSNSKKIVLDRIRKITKKDRKIMLLTCFFPQFSHKCPDEFPANFLT